MSAPKDPVALARAKAKAAETTRRDRPLRELRREADECGMHFYWSAPLGRYDLSELGRIIRLAGGLAVRLAQKPLDATSLEALKTVAHVLSDLGNPGSAPRALAVPVSGDGLRRLLAAVERQTGRKVLRRAEGSSEPSLPTAPSTAEDDAVAEALLAKFGKKPGTAQ